MERFSFAIDGLRFATAIAAATNEMYRLRDNVGQVVNGHKVTQKSVQMQCQRLEGMYIAASSLGLLGTSFAVEMAVINAYNANEFAIGKRPAWRAIDNSAMHDWDRQFASRIFTHLFAS